MDDATDVMLPLSRLSKSPRIKVRMVWRLVLGLFLHLTLLLFLAIYLELSLNSVRRYTPVANAEEIQLESLDVLPPLLGAMDAERQVRQKNGKPQDPVTYTQTRRAVEKNLLSLNTPLLLTSPEENQRRILIQQWLTEIGDAALNHPAIKPADFEALNLRSRVLLNQIDQVSDIVRAEVHTTLTGLQNQENTEAEGLVTLMWIGVGTVTLVTIVFQIIVSNSIIDPIQSLAAVVRRMQKGDYTARVHLRSRDEIESLGETFNAMAENILSTQQELQEKNARLSVQQDALRDVNTSLEQRVAEKTGELEDKNQKLNQAARLKDEFLATLSHELRTPLTPVISCAHLLSTDADLDPEQLKSVQVIDRNARALSRMIDELLDLSAAMNRKLLLVREQTELNEWTRSTLETMRPAWEKKALIVTFVPADQPVEVEIDSPRLAQVLTNLVNNAIKFTDQGGKVAVRLTASVEEVRIAVTDTGAGLTSSEIARIFEMFHQSRTQRNRNVGGLGVGLTIARSLAELHGGGLVAESPGSGQGSTFILWLPRMMESRAVDFSSTTPLPYHAPVDRNFLRGRRIILVEDSTDTRDALQRILQRRGCEVVTAATGEEGLSLALKSPPEIIISDIGLPGMSGLELMTQLRAQEAFRHTVTIALSGLGREQDIQAAAIAGFDAHLLKPVDINVLYQTLVHEVQEKSNPNLKSDK